MPVLAATTLDGSTWQVGLLTTFAGLPFLLIGLPVGAWSDRVRRRPLLITADLGRAAVLAWVPIGYVLGVLTIEQLYVVQLLVGVGTVFFDVSQGAYLPDLVGRARLVEANIPFHERRGRVTVLRGRCRDGCVLDHDEQRHRGELAADALPLPPARPDERHHTLSCLGHPSTRWRCRWSARHVPRATPDPLADQRRAGAVRSVARPVALLPNPRPATQLTAEAGPHRCGTGR